MPALRRRALLLLAATLTLHAQKTAPPPPAKVGLVTREIAPATPRNWRGAAEHSFHVTVWYPAADTVTETPQYIGPPGHPLFLAGEATPHAPFAPSLDPLPLVLLSHGSGGAALQLGWLATALARAGFLVAAVDHPGNNALHPYTPEGFVLWWERATDLSDVLTGLLADAELAPHIDRDRIAAAGFSLGGYTVLQLAGARTDVSLLFDLCRKTPADPACHSPEMKELPASEQTPSQLLAAVRKTSAESLARSADSFRDPRIRAVFALAPALSFTQTPESLRSIRIPVGLVAGAADTIAPAATNANFLKANLHGARETILPGVGHYAFLDTCTAAGQQTLPTFCTDAPGTDRQAVHDEASQLVLQFFVRALRLR